MKIKMYGTRGSIPIASPDSVRYGGNTTCLQIESDCLPLNQALVVDAGSGIVPCGYDLMTARTTSVVILYTHYHHDHTQGLPLCPLTFDPHVQKRLIGPIESGIGPLQLMEAIMKPPLFPVSFAEVRHQFTGNAIEIPHAMVIIIHPDGGLKLCHVNELCAYEDSSPAQVPMGRGRGKYSLSECLVIRMLYTNHPERTVSYRFEERSTGTTFVFLTDHENLAELPLNLGYHLRDAHLLVMDSQYDPMAYQACKAGYGHGTPEYCVQVAKKVDARRLGLTHHDPSSSDAYIDKNLAIARMVAGKIGYNGEVIACADYMTLEV